MMRFFLIGRDRTTGDVRLIGDTTFETREEALAGLGDGAASGDFAQHDLFVVDLDTVTPIVLYATPAAAPAATEPVEEPIADVWEAPLPVEEAPAEEAFPADEAPLAEEAEVGAEVSVVAEPDQAAPSELVIGQPPEEETAAKTELPAEEVLFGEEPITAEVSVAEEPIAGEETAVEEQIVAEEQPAVGAVPEDALEETPEEIDLASALRAAASSMEESGIAAPPSVEDYAAAGSLEGVEEALAAESDEPVVHADIWPWEAETAEPAAPASEGAPASVEEQSIEDVLAAIEAVTPPDAGDPAVAHEQESAVPDVAEVAEQGFGPLSEGAIVEYLADDESPADAEAAADQEQDAAVEIVADTDAAPSGAAMGTYVPVGIEEAGIEEITLLTPADPMSADEPELTTVPTGEPPAVGEATDPDKAYEPGDVGISAYTCDDCVYVDTCPKNHQDGPSTCGAFQWKPV